MWSRMTLSKMLKINKSVRKNKMKGEGKASDYYRFESYVYKTQSNQVVFRASFNRIYIYIYMYKKERSFKLFITFSW